MIEYFAKPKTLKANVKVELDLSNYAAEADLKNGTGVDTSDFAKKTNLAHLKSDVNKLDIYKLMAKPSNLSNLKSKVDKLDVDKIESAPVDLSELSDIVAVVKKAECNKLEKKINNISTTDTSKLV